MDGLEKEKQLQADAAADKTSEELVRIDEVMNAVRKVNLFVRLLWASVSNDRNEILKTQVDCILTRLFQSNDN